ncbi:hypothetical protein CLOP_g23875 [Closterium sp. NIES-67]|nr:hypothetical protein CLOP_g23875 [Closterium sp. NIES-67]
MEADRIRQKYPDRIPVIVEKARRSKVPDMDKKKYLVPADISISQFTAVIRNRIKLSRSKQYFCSLATLCLPHLHLCRPPMKNTKTVMAFFT